MAKIKDFIKIYLADFLKESRDKLKGDMHVPPTDKEVEELVVYLQEKGADPAIVGSAAVIKHLKHKDPNFKDDSFHLTKDIDIFVSSSLPNPPFGWRYDLKSPGVISWISPSGGYVDFLIAGHRFPNDLKNPKKIDKDPESVLMGCPIAALRSIFELKLNSDREKDLTDLLILARRIGIPNDLQQQPLNQTQRENLNLVNLWVEHTKN